MADPIASYTTAGIILSNPDWTEEFLDGIALLEAGRGSLMTYQEKEGQWALFQAAGGGNAESVAWDDISGRPDLSRTELYAFSIGSAPALTNGSEADAEFENGTVFQSDLLIGARIQVRLNAAGIAPTPSGYTFNSSTGTITAASTVTDANLFIMAVFSLTGTPGETDEPVEFSGEFSTEFA